VHSMAVVPSFPLAGGRAAVPSKASSIQDFNVMRGNCGNGGGGGGGGGLGGGAGGGGGRIIRRQLDFDRRSVESSDSVCSEVLASEEPSSDVDVGGRRGGGGVGGGGGMASTQQQRTGTGGVAWDLAATAEDEVAAGGLPFNGVSRTRPLVFM
jgi:hypothetical protein